MRTSTIVLDPDRVINKLDTDDLRDWLGMPRRGTDGDDERVMVLDGILRSALEACEAYCGRSIIVKKYETTSADTVIPLVPDVVSVIDVQAWDGRKWLSAKRDHFDADLETSTGYVHILEPPAGTSTYKVLYTAGYRRIPERILIAMKEYTKRMYERADDPMPYIRSYLEPYRTRERRPNVQYPRHSI